MKATCFSISAPGIGNRSEALVLGDFPEEEAKDFFVSTVLPPDLRSSVTEEVWKGIYQVWSLLKCILLVKHSWSRTAIMC